MRFAILFLIINLLSPISFAKISEGGWDSGGGSGFAAEFTSLGRDLAKHISGIPGLPFSESQFLDKVNRVAVEFTDEDLHDSAQVYPQSNLIRVSRSAWKTNTTQLELYRAEFVLHLYIMAMGIDDSNYQWTQVILDGGQAIHSYECTFGFFSTETLSIRWVDLNNDGYGDKYVGTLFVSSIIAKSKTAINVTEIEHGIVLNWIRLTGGVYVLLPKVSLNQLRPFKADISKIKSYTESGAPIIETDGTVTCRPTSY
ncbi:hypothetical protein [Bdellovibrio sp. HCB209]|uniref:hypothetical protein n=1 Tax=Bdellovibrio sp. HCB209 TaxID=3394354 RepID=UPI0039B43426